MILATADGRGVPSARTVLLKGVSERGFTFFTNYDSRQGRELGENPHAALVFYWPSLERQVCVSGEVTKLAPDESARYFATRPRGARLRSSTRPAWGNGFNPRAPRGARLDEGLRVPVIAVFQSTRPARGAT